MHVIAAKAAAFGEALKDDFKEYQKQVVKNAQVLSRGLLDAGIDLVSGGTDNHLMLIKLQGSGITGKELEIRLDSVHITANKNAVPFDPLGPSLTSGVRVGTPAATSRGFKEDEMRQVAGFIRDIIDDYEGNRGRIAEEVAELCARFPIYDR